MAGELVGPTEQQGHGVVEEWGDGCATLKGWCIPIQQGCADRGYGAICVPRRALKFAGVIPALQCRDRACVSLLLKGYV